jgi:hypothetical protein
MSGAANAGFYRYGYNERDKWVETYVLPLANAFGCAVEHGRAVYGGPLTAEVLKLISGSDAMIGFTTRRDAAGTDEMGRPQFSTHPWVVHELTAAMSQNPPLPCVEVREEGVVPPGGLIDAANLQRISYRETERAECLVAVAEALARFRSQTSVATVRLGPREVVDQLRPFIDDPSFVCRSRTLRGAVESAPQDVAVLPVQGSVLVRLRGVLPGDYVRLSIFGGERRWQSEYESLDTVDIRIENA